jgi:predicted O-methyltransferase YrrM
MRSLKQIGNAAQSQFNESRNDLYWQLYYSVVDGSIARHLLRISEPHLRRYVMGLQRHRRRDFIHAAKEISMLHEEVLALLYHLVSVSGGRVLEIGTYVGGSTVVMARAAADHGRPAIVSIEPGGRLDHNLIPSEDIFGDLQRNLTRLDLQGHTQLLHGFSSSPDIIHSVKSSIPPKGVGLLVIDADGNVERDIGLYAELLMDGAVVVLDDYTSTGAPEKSILIKEWVDSAVARGDVQSLGVWGWGTWIGRYRGG